MRNTPDLVDVLTTCDQIAMLRARRRAAADLAHHPLNEEAFFTAVQAADREYHRSYCPLIPSEECEAHDDAQLSAYATFLHTYLKAAGR